MGKQDESKVGRGRPPLRRGEVSTSVNVRLPADTYDAACVRAMRRGESIPAVMRRALERHLDDDDD